MNRPVINGNGKLAGKTSETTTDFPSPPTSRAMGRDRKICHFAFPGASTKSFREDIGRILHQRLFIAAVITSAGLSAFFIRNLISQDTFLGFRQFDIVWQGIAAAIVVFIALLLGFKKSFKTSHLRMLELALFGVGATYFAWLQIIMFRHGAVLEWAREEHHENFIRIANASNLLRWFALIVIYGTFVPNTWKRCAFYVSILTAIPLVLMFGVCSDCPIMGPHRLQSVLDLIVVLGVACAIAIFGSYKISELRQEAMEAKKIGQYHLKQLLGSGGMGEVYLGEHMMLRRACAIKLIRPEHNNDLISMSRFEREVKAMAKLTHWNTAEIFDYGISDDGTFYYVMEYLPGLSFQQMVDKYGPLSPGRTVYFLRQICDALREAHGIGLIHRDIKPSNVIACERGGVHDVAKLLDFGLVQSPGIKDIDTRLTMQGMILGSPPYMSPEQALGKGNLDARSDIYSIGSLGYFLLTGHPPFERETPMQVLMAHVYDPVRRPGELNPDIPKDLEDIVLRCLSKDAKDRFGDVVSLEEALANCSCASQWSRVVAQNWWANPNIVREPQPAVLV